MAGVVGWGVGCWRDLADSQSHVCHILPEQQSAVRIPKDHSELASPDLDGTGPKTLASVGAGGYSRTQLLGRKICLPFRRFFRLAPGLVEMNQLLHCQPAVAKRGQGIAAQPFLCVQ